MFFSLLWFNTGNAGIYGRGEVKLSPGTVDYFKDYLKGSHNETPLMFIISVDGNWSQYWFCSAGQANCAVEDPAEMIKPCERDSGQECKVFARNRTVRWKNGINPGKGKKSKFNSKMSRAEIVAKLTDLGFLEGTTTTLDETKYPKSLFPANSQKKKLGMNLKNMMKVKNGLFQHGLKCVQKKTHIIMSGLLKRL